MYILYLWNYFRFSNKFSDISCENISRLQSDNIINYVPKVIVTFLKPLLTRYINSFHSLICFCYL